MLEGPFPWLPARADVAGSSKMKHLRQSDDGRWHCNICKGPGFIDVMAHLRTKTHERHQGLSAEFAAIRSGSDGMSRFHHEDSDEDLNLQHIINEPTTAAAAASLHLPRPFTWDPVTSSWFYVVAKTAEASARRHSCELQGAKLIWEVRQAEQRISLRLLVSVAGLIEWEANIRVAAKVKFAGPEVLEDTTSSFGFFFHIFRDEITRSFNAGRCS